MRYRLCTYGTTGVAVGTTAVAVAVAGSGVPVGVGLLPFTCTEITADSAERPPALARA